MLKILFSLLLIVASPLSAKELMTAMTPVAPASNFTLETPAGTPLNLEDYAGKYVLVNFWAYWCSPCIKEFPDMQALYEQLGNEQFEIIAIHAGPYSKEAAGFVERFGITFPVVSDPDTSMAGWDVPALPVSYLVDPEGNITHQAIGARSWDADKLSALLSQ